MLHQDIQVLVLLHQLWVKGLRLAFQQSHSLRYLVVALALQVLLFLVFVAHFFYLRPQEVVLVTFSSDLKDAEGNKDGERHKQTVERHKNVVECECRTTLAHQKGHLDEYGDRHGRGQVQGRQGG